MRGACGGHLLGLSGVGGRGDRAGRMVWLKDLAVAEPVPQWGSTYVQQQAVCPHGRASRA